MAGAKLITGAYDTKNPLTIWRNAAALADLIRREKIAIIHARSRAPAWSAYLAARRTGIKYVATYHGIYNAQSALKRYLQRDHDARRRGHRQLALHRRSRPVAAQIRQGQAPRHPARHRHQGLHARKRRARSGRGHPQTMESKGGQTRHPHAGPSDALEGATRLHRSIGEIAPPQFRGRDDRRRARTRRLCCRIAWRRRSLGLVPSRQHPRPLPRYARRLHGRRRHRHPLDRTRRIWPGRS